MVLPDISVLVYAHRRDAPDHPRCRRWLERLIRDEQACGMNDLVLTGFVRIVTHARIFTSPSKVEQVLAFCQDVRDQPHCVPLAPGPRHRRIFNRLFRNAAAGGNLVPDAHFAALAIESRSEWVTTDRD